MAGIPLPTPLIDTLDKMKEDPLRQVNIVFQEDWDCVLYFLNQYDGNQQTFNAYRRELERLLQWAWLISKKSILTLDRGDIEKYIQFCLKPPKSWIGTKGIYRFINKEGKRLPNPKWRPFIATVTKSEYKAGIKPDKSKYHLSSKAIKEIFTVLSSFYNNLIENEKIQRNPVRLVKQKSRYIQKQQTHKQILRLTDDQWRFCIQTIREMSERKVIYKRILFIMSAMYLMYLRISEFIATESWTPTMNHFYQDSEKKWWFKTLGKGNKLRNVAVSEEMLAVLKSYRASLDLSPLPSPSDTTPLISKIKGHGPISDTRHIRDLIQNCFDEASVKLRKIGKINEANSLDTATVHWLRHTGISDDINKRERPLGHVRDDAGHTSIATTDRYNDIEVNKRHASAVNKKLIEQDSYEPIAKEHVTASMASENKKLSSNKERNTTLGPNDKTDKNITLKLRIYIENNSKFVRGKSKSLKDIEFWVFSQYNIKTINKDPSYGDYEITLEYTTYKDLDEKIDWIVSKAGSIVDSRNGFMELDVYTIDGEKSWPFSDWD